MSERNPLDVIAGGLLLLVIMYGFVVFARVTGSDLSLAEAMRPSWVGFALANPFLLAVAILIAVLALGSAISLVWKKLQSSG